MSSFDELSAPAQGVAVSFARHSKLRWRKPRDWGFAKGRGLVPIALPDAMAMASAFALVFVGKDFVPCTLLGPDGRDNVYIGADGAWLGAVIPPMLQAYPFDVIPYGTGELMLVVDEGSDLLNQDPNCAPFFDAAGGLSPQIKQIIAYCRKHGDAARRAAPAVAVIQALSLFDAMGAGMFRVNLARFQALKDADILSLRRVGALGLIFAHFVSMSHLSWLQRADAMPKWAAGAVQSDPNLNSFLAAMRVDPPYQNSVLVGLLNGRLKNSGHTS